MVGLGAFYRLSPNRDFNFCILSGAFSLYRKGIYGDSVMKYYLIPLLGVLLSTTAGTVSAKIEKTHRVEQFSNSQVNVWKTIIYPASHKKLAMHRHERDRVVVALSDGLLKITNNKGKSHYLKLEKDKAYYLTKDVPNELHNDENLTNHPIKVMVIELSNEKS